MLPGGFCPWFLAAKGLHGPALRCLTREAVCRGDLAPSWAALPALGSGMGQAGSWSCFSRGLASKLGHAPRVPSLCCLALQGTEGRWERCLLCPSTSPSLGSLAPWVTLDPSLPCFSLPICTKKPSPWCKVSLSLCMTVRTGSCKQMLRSHSLNQRMAFHLLQFLCALDPLLSLLLALRSCWSKLDLPGSGDPGAVQGASSPLL